MINTKIPIDNLIQHILPIDPKLHEALKTLSDNLLRTGVITPAQISSVVGVPGSTGKDGKDGTNATITDLIPTYPDITE